MNKQMKPSVRKIINLRTKGLSYKQIIKRTGASAANVSVICNKYVKNNASLTRKHIQNFMPSRSNLRKARRAADIYYSQLRKTATEKWILLLRTYKDQKFVHYICGMYDGDGSHSDKIFAFYNSDPILIKSFVSFCKRVIHRKFTCTITLHKTHRIKECMKYWSFLKIDHITRLDNRKQQKENKYRENFGTIRIVVSSPLGLAEALRTYRPK